MGPVKLPSPLLQARGAVTQILWRRACHRTATDNAAATTVFLTALPFSCTHPTPLQVSFGSILSPIGIGLMGYGFGAFFGLLPGGDVSSLMLIYGFPISVRACCCSCCACCWAWTGRLHSLPYPAGLPSCLPTCLRASAVFPAACA
jgi:hypothetical protein